MVQYIQVINVGTRVFEQLGLSNQTNYWFQYFSRTNQQLAYVGIFALHICVVRKETDYQRYSLCFSIVSRAFRGACNLVS